MRFPRCRMLLAAGFVVSCGDGLEPPESTPGRFNVIVTFASPVAPLIDIDRARITTINESDATVALDTVIAVTGVTFPIEREFTVPITAANGSFEVEIRVVTPAGDTVFGAGPISITPTTSGAPASVTAPLEYRGPGSGAVSVSIDDAASTLFFGEALRLTAATRSAGGTAILDAPIEWTSLDEDLAHVANVQTGRVTGGAQRGVARIRARLLSGVADTVLIVVQPVPSAVGIETGGGQSATVGTAVALPVVARVTAADGLGVENVWARFTAAAGHGAVNPESSLTDATGRAQAAWTLGTAAGAQSLDVSARGVAGSVATPATAQPGAPVTLTVQEGGDQTAIVGTAVALAPAVLVRDAFGNPVPGVTVAFAISGGGGGVAGASPVTNAQGIARVTSWTLGDAAGPNELTASVAPGSGALVAVISATGAPGGASAATSVVTVSAGTVASGSNVIVTLRTRDAAGNNLTTGGLAVTFTATGGVSTGMFGTTSDHGNSTYSASFTGVVAGAATTIGATIGTQAVQSSLPVVEVTPGPIATVVVTPGPTILTAFGATGQFAAQARDANNNVVPGQVFVWTSQNSGIATVDANGLATAVTNGTVEIRATTASITGHADLVIGQVVTQVVVTPGPASLSSLGATRQFTAAARDANNHPVAGQVFVWASTDNSVATVDGTGLATAAANGAVEIRATTAGVTGHADLTVGQVVTQVVVTPGPVTLTAFGATRQFAAEARDANNNAVAGQAFVWTSADAAIATVNETGLATAAGNGAVEIRATTGGVTGRADLTVGQVVTQVVVTPGTTSLTAIGATRQFAASARDANNNVVAGQVFVWSSEDNLRATVDGSGLATAAANGAVQIRATTAGVTGHADLTVGQVVTQVVVTPGPATLDALGETRQFAASARDANNNVVAGQVFAWTSTDDGVATVTGTGLASAVANGAVAIRATTAGVTGHADLMVAQAVTQVVVTPGPSTVNALGATQQFTASARDANNHVVAGQLFVWTSEDDAVATVNGTGLATAAGNGAVEIRATTASITGHADLTVAQVVNHVVVTPGPVTLNAVGAQQQFTASAHDANNNVVAGQVFTWTSGDDNTATVDGNGLASAVANGAVEIRATTAGVTGHAALTVAQTVMQVIVTPGPTTLEALGETQQFAASARDANNNVIAGQVFVWTSDDDDVATVDATGLASAVTNGAVEIRATTAGVTGHADLTVAQLVTAVVVTPGPSSISALGATRQFTAEARDANAHPVPGQPFVWSSEDDNTATVDGAGLATAVANGVVEIRATTAGVEGHADLTVAQVVIQVVVSPNTFSLGALGATQPFSAEARDANNHVVAGQVFTWTSEDDAVATVAASGLATAVANGGVEIRATTAGVTGHADLDIAQVITQVVVTPDAPASLTSLGAQQAFSAEARDANHHAVAGQAFVWTSESDAIATVSATGLATAEDNGTVEIRATTASITGLANLTIAQVATKLTFLTQPASTSAGSILSAMQVGALDALGHLVTTDDATSVTLAIAAGTGAPGATLGGTASRTVTDGIATFDNLTVNLVASGYQLGATSGSLESDQSAGFVIMPVGTTKLWTGAASTDWADGSNWSAAGTPAGSDNVFVAASAANQPVLFGDAVANDVIVESGATLDVGAFTLTAGGNIDGGNTIIGAGTLVMSGTTRTLRGTVPALSVTGTITLAAAATANGNVNVTGRLTLSGQVMTVNGEFRTSGSGILAMPTAMQSRLTVRDSAIFAGGAQNSFLRHGLIQVAGNFRQSSATSTQSFVSIAGFGDTLVTELNGTTTQHVHFDTPDSTGSGFAYFRISNSSPGGLEFDAPVFVQQRILTPWDSVPRYVFGHGRTLISRSDSIRTIVFDNVIHTVLTNPVLSRRVYMDGITFQNYDPNVDQLTVYRPTNGGDYFNMRFLSVPNAGVGAYIRAIDTDPSTQGMIVFMTNPFPATSGGLIKKEGQTPGTEARIHKFGIPPVDW